MSHEYALNKTNGKLHTAECRYVKDSSVKTISVTLPPLFNEYGKRVSCCKLCLKNDEQAKAAIEEWNLRRIRK